MGASIMVMGIGRLLTVGALFGERKDISAFCAARMNAAWRQWARLTQAYQLCQMNWSFEIVVSFRIWLGICAFFQISIFVFLAILQTRGLQERFDAVAVGDYVFVQSEARETRQ